MGTGTALNLDYRSCRFVATDGTVTTTGASCTSVRNGSDVTGASTTVVNGDTVRVKAIASSVPLGRAEVQITIGTESAWFRVTTQGVDPFSFPDLTFRTVGATVTSDEITVAGTTLTVTLSYRSCRFVGADGTVTTTGASCTPVKNGSDVTGTSTTVVAGDTVRVKVVASSPPRKGGGPGHHRRAIGLVRGRDPGPYGRSHHGRGGRHHTGLLFYFVDQAGAAPGAVVTGNVVTVTGLDRVALAKIDICQFVAIDRTRTTAGAACTLVKNGADVTATSTTVVNGDRTGVKAVANSAFGAGVNVRFFIGRPARFGWFTVRARAVGVVLAHGDGTPFGAGSARLELPAGGSTTYRVVMETPNIAWATVDVTADGDGVSVSPDRLTFTSANWNVPRIVTATTATPSARCWATT